MNNQKPKIVFIQNLLEDLGGVSQFINLISKGLLERGYEIEIGSVSLPVDGAAGYYSEEIPQWSLYGKVAPLRNEYKGFTGEQKYISAHKKFLNKARTAAKNKLDSFDSQTILIFTQVFSRSVFWDIEQDYFESIRHRTISQFHSSFRAAFESIDLNRILKYCSDDDLFVALTESDADEFQQAGLNNTAFIFNPINPALDLTRSTLEEKRVVSLSRYDSIKQVDHMVHAWALISDTIPEWQLHLYGSGPMQNELEDLIRGYNLSDSVKLMGTTENTFEVLSNSSISINTSNYEGLSLALIESSLVGVPVVAYKNSAGTAEIISHGETGLLSPLNNIEDFASSLLKLTQDNTLRLKLGNRAYNEIRTKFNYNKIIDTWEETIYNVLR